jgi:hypothetical protein
VLTTTRSGNIVYLTGCNLRIIIKEDRVEIHYASTKSEGRACGTAVIGVDKSYTEAFTDSDGAHYGVTFGVVMTACSDKVAKTGQARNRLHAIEEAHHATGRTAKADRIRSNNLGRIKLTTASSTKLLWLARKI